MWLPAMGMRGACANCWVLASPASPGGPLCKVGDVTVDSEAGRIKFVDLRNGVTLRVL